MSDTDKYSIYDSFSSEYTVKLNKNFPIELTESVNFSDSSEQKKMDTVLSDSETRNLLTCDLLEAKLFLEQRLAEHGLKDKA